MALLAKDPEMLRRGALLMMMAVPFLLYAAYASRDDALWSSITLVVALSLFGFCLWALRLARQRDAK